MPQKNWGEAIAYRIIFIVVSFHKKETQSHSQSQQLFWRLPMSRTLGLDLGTNSIGWALVEDDVAIVASGVRIFPVGVKEDDFLKQGKEVSKNVARRMARGIRRRHHRYKIRREKLIGILCEQSMMPGEEDLFSTRELYEFRAKGLDSKLNLVEFGKLLLMFNKRRGFKSNRKTLASEEAKKEEGVVKEEIHELEKKIVETKCRTVGEYFATLFKQTQSKDNWHNKDEAIERIRDRFVGREMYTKEFDMLWERQSSFYPTILTPELRTKIRDETIYYQRNLKSQKGLVGRCRFEPGKRCAPKSSQLFQEFRIWQQLSATRFVSGERIGQPLTPEEKQKAYVELMKQKKLTEAAMKKLLDIPRSVSFNDVFAAKGMDGNSTNVRLLEALGVETFSQLTDQQRFELWHILTYTDNTEKLKAIIRTKISQNILPQLNEEAIDRYAETNLEEGYCNFSTKALNRILPFLREGLEPFNAFLKAGYDPTKKIVKGQIQEVTKIPALSPNELRNPIVQQMLSETFRVVNAIVAKYGKPDMIRVELARELRKPKTEREEHRTRTIQTRKQREEYAEFLSHRFKKKIEPNSIEVKKYELWLEMGCEDPKLDNLDSFMKNGRIKDAVKYKLWKECNRISPYSGKAIPLSKLLSPEIQIEHIHPYSKTMNNEFGNLCLCESYINKDKGDKLPYEYFASKGEGALEAFKQRVAVFKGGKRWRFLAKEIPEDFLNSQLNNTRYAARELATRLQMLVPPMKDGETLRPRVQVVNGQATSALRRLWGVNSILSKGDIDTKNRGDHRHHAIDAIVIACTSPGIIHKLAKHSKFDEWSKLTNDKVTKPWRSFLGDTSDAINSIIVSYRNQKRLVGKKPNKSKAKNLEKYPDGFVKQQTVTIRGPLHEETIYGSIEFNGEETYVTRWPLRKFTEVKQLEKVVDPKVRQVLLKRVKKYNGELKKAFAENTDDPVLMYSKNGSKVPINKVRVINPSESLIEVRKDAFVESGNNYAIAIYEDKETGKRESETIPFWFAVKRALAGELIVPKEKNGKQLLFALQQRDTVVTYEEHPDEIEWDDTGYLRDHLFRVRRFSVNGQIYLDYLYVADLDEKNDRNRLFYQMAPSTLRCVRVEVDLLGNIVKKEGVA